MIDFEALVAVALFLGVLIWIAVLFNAIWFYRKSYQDIAELIDGRYVNYGFLVSALQFMMWGHYCLFPKRAIRDKVDHIFSELPATQRRQLVFHWWGIWLVCVFVLGSGLLAKLFGL